MIRGVDFVAGGKSYCLRYTTNRMCNLETALGMGVASFMRKYDAQNVPTYKDMRTIFHAGVFPAVSVEDAGDIMDDLGFDAASELTAKALMAAFPEAEVGEVAENPRMAAAE